MKDINELKYVFYVRKSSESDKRQAMSIDWQFLEMKEKSKREIKPKRFRLSIEIRICCSERFGSWISKANSRKECSSLEYTDCYFY